MRMLAFAAATMLSATAAIAQPAPNSLVLSAGSAPERTIIDGATWTCASDNNVVTCTSTGGSSQPAARACRRAVARFGAVQSFTWRGQSLSADQLAQCNQAAA
ncbi:MAG: CC_3452 family protein [Brevundimonas sp.]|uniref:CC_3452 family protein n=1 Tax=Brevundimonas sp. TaxID=1871086 RepID=UPI00391951DD